METLISVVITILAAIVCGIICLLAAHKDEIWDAIYPNRNGDVK